MGLSIVMRSAVIDLFLTWIYLGYSAEIKPKYMPYLSELNIEIVKLL